VYQKFSLFAEANFRLSPQLFNGFDCGLHAIVIPRDSIKFKNFDFKTLYDSRDWDKSPQRTSINDADDDSSLASYDNFSICQFQILLDFVIINFSFSFELDALNSLLGTKCWSIKTFQYTSAWAVFDRSLAIVRIIWTVTIPVRKFLRLVGISIPWTDSEAQKSRSHKYWWKHFKKNLAKTL
jgi:hypothetical protein